MGSNYQPAKLDVDSSLLDSQLSFVQNSTEDEIDKLFFNQMKQVLTFNIYSVTDYALSYEALHTLRHHTTA